MQKLFSRGLLWAGVVGLGVAGLSVAGSAPAIAEETASVPAQPSAPEGVATTKVTLSAVIADGAKPLRDDILWIVTRGGQGENEVVAQQTSASPVLSLAPGKYIVTAKFGTTVVSDEIAIGDTEANHVVNLNSGVIHLRMIPNAGAAQVEGPVTWEVYQYSRVDPADRKQLTVARAANQKFVLPAGYYIVRALYDDTTTELVVPVNPGRTYKYTVNLYAGNVGIAAIDTDGKTVNEPVAWEIIRATPNARGELETVTAEVSPSGSFMLREGSYIVRARAGGLFGEVPFEVRAGKTDRVKVPLKPAAVPVSAGG